MVVMGIARGKDLRIKASEKNGRKGFEPALSN